MRRLVGVMMVAIAVFFISASALALIDLPQWRQEIKDAPLIIEGVLDPANEGKTVVLV